MQDHLVWRRERLQLSSPAHHRIRLLNDQKLKLCDLASQSTLQPLYAKFWLLFLRLGNQGEGTVAAQQALSWELYSHSMDLISRALGLPAPTLTAPVTEVSYRRFCYDFAQVITTRFPQISIEE